MSGIKDISTKVRKIAYEYLDRDDPLGWFDRLYTEADMNPSIIPWAKLIPNPHLESWVNSKKIQGKGKRALNVGCGLGDDAEFLAKLGFEVIAFDISPKAIHWCKSRFPKSKVEYEVADLFNSPVTWEGAFDLVLEAYTLQALPQFLRTKAFPIIGEFVNPGGTLLIITRAREIHDNPGQIPWPLTRQETDAFQNYGLNEISFEDSIDDGIPPIRKFRVEYRK